MKRFPGLAHLFSALRLLVSLAVLLAVVGVAVPAAVLGQDQGVSTGDGAWTWQNPRPQGNNIIKMAFVDPLTGWAVGWRGLIMRTTDGGASWDIQNSGSGQALLSVAALDSNTAVVVGAGGTILATSDGGATWAKRSGGGSKNLIMVQYADPTTLYAVGRQGAFLKSEDGGETWHEDVPLSTDRDILRVQFLDASFGYVLAPRQRPPDRAIFLTEDGGTTWRRLGELPNQSLQNFRFLDRSTGLVVGSSGVVLKTPDGGQNWYPISVPTTANLWSVAYSDPDTVHIVGDGGVVLKSLDGGETWGLLPEPRPSAAHLHDVSFADTSTGYVVGFNGTLLKTTDAGASWSSLARGPRGTLRSLHFVSPQVGVAVGEGGAIAKSVDRGNTWRAVPSGTRRDLNGVRFLNRQTGFAVGDGGTILRSDDTGESWRPVESPVGVNLLGIGLAGNPETGRLDVALIVGDRNLALRSEDEGATWEQISLPGAADIPFAVSFPEPRIGYVGGAQTIWQTTDFGKSWRVVAGGRQTPRDPHSFSFPSVNRGYAVGRGGQMFRTNDGGTTWVAQASRTRATLRSVHFVDEETGYVVGDGGTVLVTNNGGVTWTGVNSGTHLDLWAVQFLDRAVGIAVGQGGAVLKTTSGGLATAHLPPAVVSISPTDNQTNVLPDDRVRITFNKDIAFDPADYGEGGRFELRDPQGLLVTASASYDAAERQVVIAPQQLLAQGTSYVARARGGAEGVSDPEGRRMVFDFTSRFRTACGIIAAGGFGKLISLDATVREKIGCPVAAEYPVQAVEQVFEGGHMLWLTDTRQVLVTFFVAGNWASYADTYEEGQEEPTITTPPDLLAPQRGFGKVWREQPGVRDRLGWAVGPARAFEGAAQDFSAGLMTWMGSEQWLLRIYYADTTTLVVPDPNQPR